MAMSRKLKGKWVKALCSGEYEQGAGELYGAGEWCCLGVLGHVCGRSKADLEGESFLVNKNDGYAILDRQTQLKLATLNDKGVPFEMIAGLIDVAL